MLYEKQKPSLGRIVLFRDELSNGSNEHPAIITRVWSDTCVNLTVFLDFSQPVLKTSIDYDDKEVPSSLYSWRWPPRV